MTSSPAASLPPELLFEIFSQFEDVEGEADQQSLKHATLVCRAWADPAQSVLWQSGATLEGDDDVRKFIRTAPRRRVGPKDISIFNLRRVELLDALWPHVEGIETLLVGSQGGVISAETFEHSALSDLTALSVKGSLIASSPSVRLPFQLSRLIIEDEGIRTRHLASFISTIAQNSTSTLRSLSLLSISRPSHADVANAVLPFAPTLRHIGLSVSKDDAAAFVPVFESATMLKSFECTSLPLPLLHALPLSLVGFATGEDAGGIDTAQLKIALDRLPRLSTLYFTFPRSHVQDIRGGLELVSEFEKRGVVWKFLDDYRD